MNYKNERNCYLNIAVEAYGWVVRAFQCVEGNGSLLLIIDQKQQNPTREIQQHSHSRSFTYSSVRTEKEKTEC